MKAHWYWRHWIPVSYGMTNLGKFMYWSNFVFVEGSNQVLGRDEINYDLGAVNWLRKKLNWPECVVLDPVTGANAEFIMGFSVPGEKLCLVAPFSAARHIKDGPFAMRLGPKRVSFFVVGTAKINLEEIGRIIRGSAEDQAAKDLVIY